MSGVRVLAASAAASVTLSLAAVAWVFAFVLPAWNTTETAASGVPRERPVPPPEPALARRLVFVVVDGLGHETAASAPAFAELRRTGALRPLEADYPTFTSPAITAMFAGLGPRLSGVRLNGDEATAPALDSVLRSAWDAGVYVRVRSRTFAPFSDLARAPAAADVAAGRWALLADLATMAALEPPTPARSGAVEILAAHLGEVDDAGHACGSACAEYEAAAAHAGETLANVAWHLDPARDVLIAVSDHGMRREHGHGGDEPEARRAFALAWGHRVRAGVVLPERPMRDVASTLAAVLAVPAPADNLGEPMLDLFEMSDAEAARRFAGTFAQATSFACAIRASEPCAAAPGIAGELASGESFERARAAQLAIVGHLDATLEGEARARRSTRTAVACGVVIVLALASVLARRHLWPERPGGFGAPLCVVVPYMAVLAAHGYAPSLSDMAGTEVFLPHAAQAGLAGALALFAAAAWSGWSHREGRFTVLATLCAMIPILAYVGADPHALGPPTASALVFQGAPVLVAACVGALAIAVRASLRTGRAGPPRP